MSHSHLKNVLIFNKNFNGIWGVCQNRKDIALLLRNDAHTAIRFCGRAACKARIGVRLVAQFVVLRKLQGEHGRTYLWKKPVVLEKKI